MDRNYQKSSFPDPVFLAEASSLSERAARAMRANDCSLPPAGKQAGTVFALHNGAPRTMNAVFLREREAGSSAPSRAVPAAEAGALLAGKETPDER